MIGQTISHYKILEKLGGGGMGVVYKAEDTKLKRTVALKFLPPVFTFDQEAKKRFINEAQTASSFQHHNICNIHDIDVTKDGQIFISMDCYEGETLKKKIERGHLKTDEAIDIIVQVATGLQKAHEKGIIHRDIKPANIFITNDGVVKILDFGLAKLSGQTMMTKMGEAVGTIAYMSPEQTRGEQVDQRTDIWSLGVVLYEMLTGLLPFQGEYEQAIIYSILSEQPNKIDLIRKNIPKQIIDIVEKSIEKNVVRRYQNLIEVIKDLENAKSVSFRVKKEKSILVLPFDDMSPTKDNEYFSDGLTEEIITDLAHIQDLLVISRSSAMTFKGTKRSIPEIAKSVNVKYVLEGSVRKAGNSLRITAQLIDAENDFHLWANKFNGTLDDVFEIQEKVSRSIVNSLMLKLTPKEDNLLTEHPITEPLSYEFYLKARQEILKYTEDGLINAQQYLQNGLELSGANSLFYAGLAYVNYGLINLGFRDKETTLKIAQDYIDKAIELEPTNPKVNFVQGLLLSLDHPRKAIRILNQVLQINPNDFDTLFFLSCLVGTFGKRTIVTPFEEKTIKIDPLNPAAHFHSGFNRFWEGDFKLACRILEKLNKSFPQDPLTKFSFALSLAYSGNKDSAELIFNEIVKEHPDGFFSSMSLAFIYSLAGKRSETMQILDSNPKLLKTTDAQLIYLIADCYSLIGETELALKWLDRFVNLGIVNYPLLNELDPFLNNIRNDPGFKSLVEKMRYEWEEFKL